MVQNVFAFILFMIMLMLMKKKPVETLPNALKIGGLGALLAIHLMFFFGSIKYSNVSIGVVCYSLVGFFTVLLEPLIQKTKFSFVELFYSLIAVVGIWLIFSFDTSYRFGIILGVISAALFALYTLFNKILEPGKSSRCMLFYELLGGSWFMSLFLPVYLHFCPAANILPSGIDWFWLLILAFFCTVLLYLIHISVLKSLSAFTVSLAGNLEPIYGILFAILFFGEAHDLS
ncbi:MAG: DMT family transporter, partial [Candidatus Gastranaerophilaceae bacterium]